MKKHLFSFIGAVSALAVSAQLPVSTAPSNKKAVLEEFTGIHCGYCPDGHRIANNTYTADPTNVILVNIHSGGYANPSAGEPDFRTPEGAAIDAMPGQSIAGYPAGTINRKVMPGSQTAGGMAESRSSWASNAATIKSQAAYLNVALQGTIDVTTRLLTVEAQVYYTANSPATSNSLTIMLLQNGIRGPQSNYGTPYWYNLPNYNSDMTYNHNHVLRACITPTFGQTIPVTTTGTTYSTILTYQIPTDYGVAGKTTACVLSDLEIVAFVTESNVNIINAAHGPITYGGLANTLDIGTNSLSVESEVCAGSLNPSFKFTNNGSTAVTSAVFSYAVNGGAASTYTYTGNVNSLQTSSVITLPSMVFTPANSNSLSINVVSVNGGTDQNAANNAINKTLTVTSNVARDLSIQIDFLQDRYGVENKWTLYDEVTGAVIDSDGPYTNLGSTGTSLHTKYVTVDNNTCYKLVAEDSGGNGINVGFGVGGYTVSTSEGDVLFKSNGKYAKSETKFFKTQVNAVGIDKNAMNVNAIRVYPNPASGLTSVAVSLSQSETLNVNVVNSLGQTVYSTSADMTAGENKLQLNTENMTAGVYFVNVVSKKGAVQHKLIVSK